MQTALTEMVGIDHPVVGFNRSPEVVKAVSEGGGLGVFAATMYSPEELDAQLTWLDQQLGGRPYGVDLLIPSNPVGGDPKNLVSSLREQLPREHLDFVAELMDKYGIPPLPDGVEANPGTNLDSSFVPQLLDVIFSHDVALVANGLGAPPSEMVDSAKAKGIPVASLVGKASHAKRQLEAGVDILVAQGTEAGGHTGDIATMILTPEVVEIAGSRPVLAAGGIASGAQMAAGLALGASGVWTGSVWLSSEEDVANAIVKDKFIEATSSDTVRSRARSGKPARQLRSAWHDEWDREETPIPLAMPLQRFLTAEAWDRIDAAAVNGNAGARELESFYIGQVVGSFASVRPAGEILAEIVADCREVLDRLYTL